MSISTSRLAYTDCIDLMDAAIESSLGVRYPFGKGPRGRDAAFHYRMRVHQARKLVREDNERIYADDPGHPLHGRSIYDPLVFRIREADGEFYLYGEKTSIDLGAIEPLDEIEGEFIEATLVLEQPKAEVEPKQLEYLGPKIQRRV